MSELLATKMSELFATKMSEFFATKMSDPFLWKTEAASSPGLPDFYWYKISKGEKCTKLPQTIPNGHIIYQTSSIARPSKFYSNWYFWFENIPSGNRFPLGQFILV
jgi:hypothetical protein